MCYANLIADSTKQTDCASSQSNSEKLVHAKVILWGALFLDTLAQAKKSSLLMQKVILV